MGLVSTHQLSTFTTPVNGTSPIDANQVKGNDNSIKTSYNAHDADTTIHLQSGAVATRPAASTAGQTWLATDSGAVYLWLDNGSAWVEANYLRSTGGTVTGNVLITGTLGVTGATTLSSTLTIGGVTYTFPASQGANQYLKTDGSGNLSWVTFLETLALTDLSDVTITSVASGQFLLYNGTVWVNGTNGSALTTLNASNLSSGTVNTARVAGSYTGITAVGTLTAGAISTGFTAIADTFLATISTASKVSNSATTATNANTASAIVARDASGNFTAGTVTAALTGNATTATTLATARAINGVNFDGSAAITVTAAAGTLTGTTLASNVTLSSLTSVGTLSAGAVPASLVTAGTFGAGAYTFPGALAITGALTGVTTLTASSTATIGAATSPLLLDRLADFTNYGAMSFNASLISTTMNGLYGRLNATDGGLYITAPSGSSTKLQVAGSTVATFAGALTTLATPLAITGAFTGATTGAFSGKITSTVGNNAIYFESASATTGYHYTQIKNTSAWMILGIEGSVAGSLATNSTAYSTVLVTQNATDLILGTNQTTNLKIANGGAATFSSTLAVTGAATFSGAITSTVGNNATVLSNTSATTGYQQIYFQNTSGGVRLGVNGSTAAALLTGGNAYAATLDNLGNYPLDFGTNGIRRGGFSAAGAFDLTSTLTVTGATNLNERVIVSGTGQVLTLIKTSNSQPSMLFTGVASSNFTAGIGSGDVFVITKNDGTTAILTLTQAGAATFSGTVTASTVYSTTVGATNRDLYIDNTGLMGYVSSIRAAKTNITPLTDTAWLDALTPVAFNYRKKDEDGAYTDEANTPLEYGLIAEEVEGVNAELVFYDETEDGLALRGVSYNKLMIPLLQRVQTLTARNDALTARVAALEAV